MDQSRFDIELHPKAAKEYKKLDGSVKQIVNKAFKHLEVRADEVGKELENKQHTKLYGCKEVKIKGIGIRIVFRIVGEKAEIVQIITIGKREDDEVFQDAHKRLQEMTKVEKPFKKFKGF
ncbi:type II toxin-antitoxin system RelE family toxin [Bacillus paranthracis]|uniref:type II toxin-antitoxin system RelE family toxin n=1 Tax=Bacteria TaxID=2 RepID=UPI000771B885|nr:MULTISPECIES: type II toxin-antitoxin system mRNA interferase toxin, RelE/StbE family [Bacillus]KAB7630656.1 type II toxin-antitoxin system mRNA interferase toxin, RelE/StbE family [Bacillus sp. B4-WWTP-NA-D-NA-NA]KXI55346.1 hypothetical protein ACS45_02230 [Bacillus cereus]MDA1829676.1 type II toxin-antitoxin system mRNA interferase toxin, RelE/StbE family [Bacillus cereus group sp. BY25LC]RXC11511.1 type II toxin-antitoxin system mRNA interferase toxin, RelE/StbE family [Escherichia coli]